MDVYRIIYRKDGALRTAYVVAVSLEAAAALVADTEGYVETVLAKVLSKPGDRIFVAEAEGEPPPTRPAPKKKAKV